MINVYDFYRLVLFGFTLYSSITFIISLLKYKQSYIKVPNFVTKYVVKQGSTVLGKQLNNNKQDIIINFVLLLVLIALNLVLFWV